MSASRLLAPAVGLGASAVAAGAYLAAKPRIAEWIPQPFVSGGYDAILGVLAVSAALLVVRWLERGSASSGPPDASAPDLWLLPRPVTVRLSAIAAALSGVHLFDYALKHAIAFEYLQPMPLFDLGREGNVPTLFATGLFGLAALLLWGIGRAERRRAAPAFTWLALAGVFGFLAVDEFAMIHESVNGFAAGLLAPEARFGSEWVLVYGALVAALAPACLPWLLRMPARTRRLVVVAGAIYLAGAIGLEALGGQAPRGSVVRDLWTWVEETLELAGQLVFLYALLDYSRREHGALRLTARVEVG